MVKDKKICSDCEHFDWCWLTRFSKIETHAERCITYVRKWWKFWRPR